VPPKTASLFFERTPTRASGTPKATKKGQVYQTIAERVKKTAVDPPPKDSVRSGWTGGATPVLVENGPDGPWPRKKALKKSVWETGVRRNSAVAVAV
jgi:hypothetical protein